jgi:hypothetical protein
MSLEGGKKNSPKNAIRRGLIVGSIAAGAMLYGGVEGKKIGAEQALDQMNDHLLTPAAVDLLKELTGATDRDVSDLESNLKQLMLDELKRIKDRNRPT